MMKRKFTEIISIVGEAPSYFSGERRYISTGAVDGFNVNEGDVELVTYDSRPSRANLTARENDILFAKMAETLKTLRLDKDSARDIYSTGFCAVRAKEDSITPKCLYYLVSSPAFLSQKDKHASGATQRAITNAGMMNIIINVPSLEEQGKAIKILDAVSSAIAKRREQLSKIDDLVKSQFIEMFGKPDKNPKGWEIHRLSTCLEVVGGYAFKSEDFKSSGIPVLRIGNINSGVFQENNLVFWEYDSALEKYIMKPGDLVISLTGTVGKDDYANVCILGDKYKRYYLNQRNAQLKIGTTLNKLYIAQLLRFPEIKRRLTGISRGVRQANVANRDILNLSIPLPPIERQNEFARFVEQTDKSKVLFLAHAILMKLLLFSRKNEKNMLYLSCINLFDHREAII